MILIFTLVVIVLFVQAVIDYKNNPPSGGLMP